MGILLKSQYIIKYADYRDNLALKSNVKDIYIGPYLDTIYNQKIAGSSPLNLKEELVPYLPEDSPPQFISPTFTKYSELKRDIQKTVIKRKPIPTKPIPTDEDYKKGYFNRYLFLDYRYGVFIETSKEEFENKSQIDTLTFIPYMIKWDLVTDLKNSLTLTSLEQLGSLNTSPYDYIAELDDTSSEDTETEDEDEEDNYVI